MNNLQVVPVRSRSDMKAFIDLPWTLYQGDENWVPPIKSEQIKLLTPGKHPFWNFSERELFIAKRGSEAVGRVAAIVDGNYNQHYREKMGAWGFFECERSPETASALFSAAEQWVREKGQDQIRGPLNPSVNYEIGLLIQGFDLPPSLGFTYNPQYYHELVRSSGFRKDKDVLAYRFTENHPIPDWAFEVSERLSQKEEITIRLVNLKNFDEELALINKIYNDCWSANWGAVPMTREEVYHVGKEMLSFVDPDLVFFLYFRQEPVGVALVLPDINPLLKRFNGRLGISALLKKHLYWSDIKGLRGYIMGIKEEYRQMGVPLVAFNYFMNAMKKKTQYHYMEVGWQLEDNDAINLLYDEGGGKPSRRFRIYLKDL